MKLSLLAFLTALPLFCGSALAIPMGPFQANDTGGIIAYSPEAYRQRHVIAAAQCGYFGKQYRFTSVRKRYGEYIVFACYWPRGRLVRGLRTYDLYLPY